MIKKFSYIVVTLIFSLTMGVSAAAPKTQNKLKKIDQQIKQTNTKISSTNQKKARIERKLKVSEQAIGRLSRANKLTTAKLKQQQKSLDRLNKQETALLTNLKSQKTALGNQLRTAYILGHEPYLKMLLNAQNPTKFSRISAYYHYFSQFHLKEIHKIENTLSQLQNTRSAITQNKIALAMLIKDQTQQKAQLTKTYKNRKQLVNTLGRAIKTSQQKLKQLRQNKQALEGLIKRIQTQRIAQQKIAFSKRRGKLSWPLTGKITQRFGTRLQNSSLKSQGVMIKAKLGQSVYAVANGTVAFANWMPGYGLLLIINHGQGYMTIYGHNQSLMVKEGAIVTAGQLISTVGVSGGIHQPGLYFAIRHNGQPLNPNAWCRRKSTSSRRA